VLAGSGTTKERKIKLGILITFSWMVWKERNRRIFEAQELSAQTLACLIQDYIAFQSRAYASMD
jgi:hypothetical protein